MSSTATNRFSRTREDHARELDEDYVELVQALIEEKGEARATDLAERLNVSHVTVSKRVTRLKKTGLVRGERYRSIFLTPKGAALANESRERHRVVLDFLRGLGVPEEVAQADAEGIEHHVSEATLAAMARSLGREGDKPLPAHG